MTRMVQLTVAADLTEAEEIRRCSRQPGSHVRWNKPSSTIRRGSTTGRSGARSRVGARGAQDAIESLTDPDEFIGDE